MKVNLVSIQLLLQLLHSACCMRILGVFPHVGRTHFVVFQPLLRALAERGHQVTVVSHFPSDILIPNYKDISLAGTVPLWTSMIPIDTLTIVPFVDSLMRFVRSELLLAGNGRSTCKAMIENEQVQSIREGDYDLVIVEQFNSDCGFGLVHRLKVPFVGITSHTPRPYSYERIGFPENPSYVSSYHHGLTDRSIFDRIEIMMLNKLSKVMHYYNSQLPEHAMLQEKFGDDLPPLEDIARNMSMMMVYTYFPMTGSMPIAPNIKEIGGLHLHYKNTQLPADLEKFMDASPDGVVVFSMGSLIIGSTWPKEQLKAFQEAFAEFPQKFLWKWEQEEGVLDMPENVKLIKWLPQFEVLNHKNVKAFITHGGMLSMTEAVYAGVPVITIPGFGDQFNNGLNARDKGVGEVLYVTNITKDSVVWALKEVLNERCLTNAKRLSSVWKDRPTSAMDEAVYWIEHIHRHGGDHLRPSWMNVTIVQYLQLDVVFLVACLVLAVVWLMRRSKGKAKID